MSAERRLSPSTAVPTGLSGPQLRCGSVMESTSTGLFWPPKLSLGTSQALVQRMDTFACVALLSQGSQGLQIADVPPAPRTACFTHHDFVSFQVISFTLFSTPCEKHILGANSPGSISSAASHLARLPAFLFLNRAHRCTSQLALRYFRVYSATKIIMLV